KTPESARKFPWVAFGRNARDIFSIVFYFQTAKQSFTQHSRQAVLCGHANQSLVSSVKGRHFNPVNVWDYLHIWKVDIALSWVCDISKNRYFFVRMTLCIIDNP